MIPNPNDLHTVNEFQSSREVIFRARMVGKLPVSFLTHYLIGNTIRIRDLEQYRFTSQNPIATRFHAKDRHTIGFARIPWRMPIALRRSDMPLKILRSVMASSISCRTPFHVFNFCLTSFAVHIKRTFYCVTTFNWSFGVKVHPG